ASSAASFGSMARGEDDSGLGRRRGFFFERIREWSLSACLLERRRQPIPPVGVVAGRGRPRTLFALWSGLARKGRAHSHPANAIDTIRFTANCYGLPGTHVPGSPGDTDNRPPTTPRDAYPGAAVCPEVSPLPPVGVFLHGSIFCRVVLRLKDLEIDHRE